MQKKIKEWMIQTGTSICQRCKGALDAVRHFSIRAFWQELLQSLKEELYPFSWKKGLRYYRRPLVVLLVFCMLWAAPVIAANTNKDSLYDWWPDYVTIPLAGYPYKTFFPAFLRKDPRIIEENQLLKSDCYRQFDPNFRSDYRWLLQIYSSVDDQKVENLFQEDQYLSGVMIICKAEVLSRRRMREWYIDKADEYQTKDELEYNTLDFIKVRIQDVLFDPYDLYSNGDEIIISTYLLGGSDLEPGNRTYLFMTHPQKHWKARPNDFLDYFQSTLNCHYEWGFLDNSTLMSTWYINRDNTIAFAEGDFPVRSDTAETYTRPFWGTKIICETYTEDQIDQYLYENLTVYEDLWRKYAKRSIEPK